MIQEMEKRLKEFFNLGKYFLLSASSIEDCLREAQDTQRYITELIEIRKFFDELQTKSNNKLHVFMGKHRDAIRRDFKKTGESVTEQRIEDRLLSIYGHEYLTLKEDYDYNRMRFEQANTFISMMFQRKSFITETIDFFKYNKEREGCIMNNRAFISKLEKVIGV